MNTIHDQRGALGVSELRHVDLNSLVALDVLLRLGSVTRAAQELGVTQSAMSHTLARLRGMFDDPLLVRSGNSLLLTPRAEELSVPIRSALVSLSRTLAPGQSFDPKTSRRTFCIASPDLFDLWLLPALLERIQCEAPQVDLAVVPMPGRIADFLETGDVDIVLAPALLGSDAPYGPALAERLMQRTLIRDRFFAYVRRGHPVARRKRLSLRQYVRLPHLLVSPTGVGPGLVDAYLEREGLARRVALRVSTFSSALAVLDRSDLVLTAPSVLKSITGVGESLVALGVPLSLPDHTLSLVWHPRFTSDAGHRWLRDMLTGLLQAATRE